VSLWVTHLIEGAKAVSLQIDGSEVKKARESVNILLRALMPNGEVKTVLLCSVTMTSKTANAELSPLLDAIGRHCLQHRIMAFVSDNTNSQPVLLQLLNASLKRYIPRIPCDCHVFSLSYIAAMECICAAFPGSESAPRFKSAYLSAYDCVVALYVNMQRLRKEYADLLASYTDGAVTLPHWPLPYTSRWGQVCCVGG
jgi:DNA-binding protein